MTLPAMKRALASLLVVVLACPVTAQDLPDLGEAAQSGFSPQRERRIGEWIMRDIRRDRDFLDDPEVVDYIESVGRRLVAVSADARQEFEFFVIRDNTINAFAMPGGFVGVHTGLITSAQSESELAGVLAHEVSHVTQRHIARMLDKQSQLQLAALAGLVVALLAARSNPQVTQAAIATSQAGAIQASLNYSREFEREADRVGFQLMEASGFDPNGMPAFFGRLQKATRLIENNAPAYLRTHPLNIERMSDLENRAANVRYRQRPDSREFQLVRAKLRAMHGAPAEAVAALEGQVRDRRFLDEGAARYGLAVALDRARDAKRARAELAEARKLVGAHPMLDTFDARMRIAQGDARGASELLAQSLRAHERRPYLVYAHIEALQAGGQHRDAVGLLEELVKERPREVRAYALQAKSYANLDRRALQHRAQAELYALQGSYPAAIEQLRFAQRAGDADFYTGSAIDARMRALRAREQEEKKEGRPF